MVAGGLRKPRPGHHVVGALSPIRLISTDATGTSGTS